MEEEETSMGMGMCVVYFCDVEGIYIYIYIYGTQRPQSLDYCFTNGIAFSSLARKYCFCVH